MSEPPNLKEKRLLVELTNELSSAVQNHEERYVSPVELRKLYRKFCTWCQLFHSSKQESSIRNLTHLLQLEDIHIYYPHSESTVVHYLLERFYWIRYGDSDIVVDLLYKLNSADGHLGKIFDFKLLSVAPKLKIRETTWKRDVLYDAEILPLKYFLEHTNRKKALFDGERLAERYFANFIQDLRNWRHVLWLPPCSTSLRYPEELIELLQHGLFANSASRNSDEMNIGKLLTGVIGVILNSNPTSSNPPPLHTKRAIEAGNILLRAVPCVNMQTLLKGQKIQNKARVIQHIMQQLSVPRYLPFLKLRCNGPQELKHLSRCAIRQVLYKNWKLPHGISALPIHAMLKEYLNLLDD